MFVNGHLTTFSHPSSGHRTHSFTGQARPLLSGSVSGKLALYSLFCALELVSKEIRNSDPV